MPQPVPAHRFAFTLPRWLLIYAQTAPAAPADDATRMRWVIEMARRNVAHHGGPFAAAVFARDSGRLIAVGVNRVLRGGSSILHAEIIAIALAQQQLGHYQLNAPGLPLCELVSSTEPCAMCLGAIGWSGLTRVLIGARDSDARAIGFDEGAKPRRWRRALAARGIDTRCDCCRTEAAQLLRDYADAGGAIYNAGSALAAGGARAS